MDIWIFAAAAGAGIFAKYMKNCSRDRARLELSSGGADVKKPKSPVPSRELQSKSCPFRTWRRKRIGDETIEGEKVPDTNFEGTSLDDALHMGVGCECGFVGEKVVNSGSEPCEDCHLLSISNLSPRLLWCENLQEIENGRKETDGVVKSSGDLLSINSVGETRSFHASSRERNSIRYRQSLYPHLVKPLNSLEGCIIAQLCEERAEMENKLLNSTPAVCLSSVSFRPWFVLDGSQISIPGEEISIMQTRIGGREKFHHGHCLKDRETVVGSTPLPRIESLELSKTLKSDVGKGQNGRLNSFCSAGCRNHLHTKESSWVANVTYPFSLGVSVGIISSAITYKKEVDQVKQLLKQTENLVEDLQEELEMKDTLTVKELADGDHESHDTLGSSFHSRKPNVLSPQIGFDKLNKDDEEPCDHDMEKISKSRSKIEEELEAELERLELSMNSSSLGTRVSNFAEVDPEFVADFVQGELRAEVIGGRAHVLPDSNRSTPRAHSANYAVSPWELTLRLHEVIQSKLECRIKELEAALQNSHRKVDLMEFEPMNEASESATAKRYSQNQHVVMNLSQETLDAYNNTYKELMKTEVPVEECSVSVSQVTGGNELVLYPELHEEGTPSPCEVNDSKHQIMWFQRLDGDINDDENSDCDAETEKQLIQQLVEKTKKGSTLVLNAQKLLSSMDETEH